MTRCSPSPISHEQPRQTPRRSLSLVRVRSLLGRPRAGSRSCKDRAPQLVDWFAEPHAAADRRKSGGCSHLHQYARRAPDPRPQRPPWPLRVRLAGNYRGGVSGKYRSRRRHRWRASASEFPRRRSRPCRSRCRRGRRIQWLRSRRRDLSDYAGPLCRRRCVQ